LKRINKYEYTRRLRQKRKVYRTKHGFWKMPYYFNWGEEEKAKEKQKEGEEKDSC